MKLHPLALLLFVFAIRLSAADAIVAADGSGQYKSVNQAIASAPQPVPAGKYWTILVKPGVYEEVVYVQRERGRIRLVGENAETTKITAALHAKTLGPDGKPIGTFRTPTFYIDADDFIVENLTMENSAGPVGQALALRVDGDRVVFRNCRFLGWQDTVLVNRGRHYFKDCLIAGATDFIFGAGNSYFDGCTIRVDGGNYITAASTPQDQPCGLVFSRCKIVGSKPEVRTLLGRPWRQYAMTVFLNCEMSDVVSPEGWHNWGKPANEKTARYAEHGNTGNGAARDKRVPWARELSADEAAALSLEKVLGGSDNWNPSTQKF